ncbi:MAG TPA: hypothetical protein VIU64_20100 [Polyangia bacterium]
MGCRRQRRWPALVAIIGRGRGVASLVVFVAGIALGGAARADRNDLRLANLCNSSSGTCDWFKPSPTGGTTLVLDPQAASRFRSLMSELGVAVAPRLQTPADTLGFAGVQVSAELGFTEISNNHSFWDGTEGVQPLNPRVSRPPGTLATVGAFVRKGMFYPVPAIELGAGAVNVLQSGMWALQAYGKIALQEGFHDTPLPSVAIRIAFSDLVGTDQVDLDVWSADAVLSKAFGVGGTVRLEPFLGWNLLLIDAKSNLVDAPAQGGATTTAVMKFRFSDQDLILRNRWFAGMKARLWKLFVSAEFAFAPAGHSSDGSASSEKASDGSQSQKSVGISAGFDL